MRQGSVTGSTRSAGRPHPRPGRPLSPCRSLCVKDVIQTPNVRCRFWHHSRPSASRAAPAIQSAVCVALWAFYQIRRGGSNRLHGLFSAHFRRSARFSVFIPRLLLYAPVYSLTLPFLQFRTGFLNISPPFALLRQTPVFRVFAEISQRFYIFLHAFTNPFFRPAANHFPSPAHRKTPRTPAVQPACGAHRRCGQNQPLRRGNSVSMHWDGSSRLHSSSIAEPSGSWSASATRSSSCTSYCLPSTS